MAEAIQDGTASVKIFTTDVTTGQDGVRFDTGGLLDLMRVVAENGAIMAVHAEDDELVKYMEANYSIWEGWEVRGWPVMTMLRGKIMVEDGQLQGSPHDGQWVKRKLQPEVLAHPSA